jgi:phosphoglycolate phosphatase
LQSPTAIIFDLDGTLVDSVPDIQCALNAVLEQNALPCLEIEAVKLMIGGGPEILIRRALDKLGFVRTPDEIGHLTMSFQHAYHEQGNTLSALFPGALRCLEQVTSQDIPIGLCSNKPEQLCQQLLADLGIEHLFAAVQGSGSGLPPKPHPAALLATLRRLDATANSALYVGDSATDVETAGRAGVPVALVRGGYTATPADSLGANWVVAGLADIPSIWQ